MKTETIDVLWWNVQRLFRPHGAGGAPALGLAVDPGWDAEAYRAKLENVAAVIRHAVSPETTGLIGLAEVEDGRVVRDLLRAIGDPQLAAAELPARRGQGSDVGVLYSRRHFTLAAPPVAYNVHNRRHARDLVQVDRGGERMQYVAGSLASVIAEGVRTRAGRSVEAVGRGGRPRGFRQEARSGASDHLPLIARIQIAG